MSRQPSAFLETIIALLMPYFAGTAADLHDARSEIIDTLASYATRTRAEILQAAQIVAFGMTTLDVLAEAKTAEMSTSLRIRFRGCANGLNRSAIQTEKALHQSLACAAAPVEPAGDVPDTEVPPVVRDVRNRIDLDCNPISPNRIRPGTRQDRDTRLWAGAMIDTLRQMGIPVLPAQGG